MAKFSEPVAATTPASLLFRLSIDQRDAGKALEIALASGILTSQIPWKTKRNSLPEENPLDLWYDNGNG